jgi:hypothetical protein
VIIPVLVSVAYCLTILGETLHKKLGFLRFNSLKTLGEILTSNFHWLAKKHGCRKWGYVVSNAIVVLAAVLTYSDVREEISRLLRRDSVSLHAVLLAIC